MSTSSDLDLTQEDAIRLWENTVGDSGQAPEDEELHAFAVAVERAAYGVIEAQVRAQIAADIEAERAGKGSLHYRYGYSTAIEDAARIARGDS